MSLSTTGHAAMLRIERYRREAEERYRRLDDVLAGMPDEPVPKSNNKPPTGEAP